MEDPSQGPEIDQDPSYHHEIEGMTSPDPKGPTRKQGTS